MSNDWPTILYFGNDWYGDNRTSSHHIARLLSKRFRVVYVECPGLRAPKGTSRDFKKLFSKLKKAGQGAKRINEDMMLFTLFQIPFHRFGFVRKLNTMLVRASLRSLCRRLRIDAPVLWFVVPHVAFVMGALNEKAAVYYCIDDYSSLPGVNKEWVREMDELLTRKADIVFVSAAPLLESKKRMNARVVLSRHGVDYEHFNQACSDRVEIAQEVKDLKHPVIGFFGLIESWVDLELVKFIAQSRPHWSILMIGRVAVSENPCEGLANVHFIGSRRYEILPTYAKVFDVAIIPCKVDDLIINFNPLKLREYLAMGKPVVSVRVPEVEAFKEVIGIADDHEDFLAKIDAALARDTEEMRRKRLDSVKDSSWEQRVNTVVEAVEEVMRSK